MFPVSDQDRLARSQLVKDASLLRFKLLVISLLKVLALLESRDTSQVLLVGHQVVFLGDLPFSSHLMIELGQNV